MRLAIDYRNIRIAKQDGIDAFVHMVWVQHVCDLTTNYLSSSKK
jgi:hypothetical protein